MARQRSRRGSSAMEIALVAPVLVLIVAGIFDYSWYAFSQQTLNSAVLEATRAASLADWEDSPAETARQALGESLEGTVLSPSRTKVSATYVGDPPEMSLCVDVAVEYSSLFGLVPTPEAVTTSMTMRLEDQPDEDEVEG